MNPLLSSTLDYNNYLSSRLKSAVTQQTPKNNGKKTNSSSSSGNESESIILNTKKISITSKSNLPPKNKSKHLKNENKIVDTVLESSFVQQHSWRRHLDTNPNNRSSEVLMKSIEMDGSKLSFSECAYQSSEDEQNYTSDFNPATTKEESGYEVEKKIVTAIASPKMINNPVILTSDSPALNAPITISSWTACEPRVLASSTSALSTCRDYFKRWLLYLVRIRYIYQRLSAISSRTASRVLRIRFSEWLAAARAQQQLCKLVSQKTRLRLLGRSLPLWAGVQKQRDQANRCSRHRTLYLMSSVFSCWRGRVREALEERQLETDHSARLRQISALVSKLSLPPPPSSPPRLASASARPRSSSAHRRAGGGLEQQRPATDRPPIRPAPRPLSRSQQRPVPEPEPTSRSGRLSDMRQQAQQRVAQQREREALAVAEKVRLEEAAEAQLREQKSQEINRARDAADRAQQQQRRREEREAAEQQRREQIACSWRTRQLVIRGWSGWALLLSLAREGVYRARLHRRRGLLRLTWTMLVDYVAAYRLQRRRAEARAGMVADRLRCRRLAQRVWRAWRSVRVALETRATAVRRHGTRLSARRRCFAAWRQALERALRREAAALRSAGQRARRGTLRRCWDDWRRFLRLEAEEAEVEQRALAAWRKVQTWL